MKIVSWNVNGLRAIMKKGFIESVEELNPDVLFLQETKMQEHQLEEEILLKDFYHILRYFLLLYFYYGLLHHLI